MRVLILSCNTGGGHNAAGQAIASQLVELGEEAYFFDYLTLAGKNVSNLVGGSYVNLVKKFPGLFGVLYKLGGIVSRITKKSPVYYANGKMANYLGKYLEKNKFDAIVMPHLFPAETITYMKRKGIPLPLTVAVATDYTCIPFWGETECDYYVIPSKELKQEFITGKIEDKQLLPLGIPVDLEFNKECSKMEARKILGIPSKERIYLIVGGSMGAGKINVFVSVLSKIKNKREQIIVICGSNQKMKKRLSKMFKKDRTITILGKTDRMALYMRACDLIYTKPGGLTSTEAAVSEIPLVHTAPIPGCETKNRQFYRKHGMSISSKNPLRQAVVGVRLLENEERCKKMKDNQRKYIEKDAAYQICCFLREHVEKND